MTHLNMILQIPYMIFVLRKMSFRLPPRQQINNAPFMKTEQNMKDSIANLLMRSQLGQLFPHLLHLVGVHLKPTNPSQSTCMTQ